MTILFFRYPLLIFLWCGLAFFSFVPESQPAAPLAPNKSSVTSPPAGLRFSATRPLPATISEENAMFIAETAARLDALQTVIRSLIALPEVRIAVAIGTPSSQPTNLLALAHATARTTVLLRSKSRKNATATVTIILENDNSALSREKRVRDALLHPDRLTLHEKTVLREKKLLEAIDAALSPRSATMDNRDDASGKNLPDLLNELKALAILTQILPLYDGLWKDPVAVRNAMQTALALAPDSALCRNAMGDASLQLGRSQEAWEEQALAIRSAPDFARAFHSRGTAALALGHLSSAVADFSEAIRLSPQTAAYYQARGMARHLQGESRPMCEDLHRACTLGECKEFQWAVAESLCDSK